MIVNMKKIHLIVQKKDTVSALDELRGLGAVHVEHQEELKSPSISELKDEIEVLQKVRTTLTAQKGKAEQKESADLEARSDLILERLDTVEQLNDAIDGRAKQIAYWQEWGEFDPKDFKALREKSVFVELCEVPTAQLKEVPGHIVIEGIQTKGKMERCLLIAEERIEVPFETIAPPEMSVNQMKAEQKKDKEQLSEIERKLQENTRYIDFVEENIERLESELTFEEVAQGMQEKEELSVLKGFCPESDSDSLEAAAKQNNWAILIEDVTEEDNPPTLLQNPKWIELSKPALNVIEILPGFKELDVSAVFLIFFTFFFAMLIGDAAYGAIFMAGTILAHIKMKNVADKTAFYLMYLLTGGTIVWGVLTGTYFGQQWLPSTVDAIVPWLNNANNVQWLCFTVAVVHLSLARIWAAQVKFPSITFLSEVGWLLIVWGMYFVANMFVLNQPLPGYALWFLSVGIPLALIFMFPFKQIGKLGQEIIPFILGVIGAGTDIISYIRLFAVGLATVAVADAANSMPAALGAGGYVLMVFLHALNLILAAMAILVHAIRLNVLEFSGHLGLEWVGFKYDPFKK